MDNIKKNRKVGLDILRTLAVILVLTVHFFANTKFYSTNLIGKNIYIQTIIRNFCMICVPLFMIITGYFNREQKYNLKFFKKLFSVILIWLFYSLIEYIYKTPIKEMNILDIINNIFSFKACSYSWYINMYIGLYLLTPLINNGLKNLNHKENIILLIIMIYMTLFSNIFKEIFKIGIIFPTWWINIYPLTYYLIGNYIANNKINISKKVLLINILIISVFEFIFQYKASNSGPYSWNETLSWNSIINALNTVSIFLLLYNVDIKSKFISNIFKFISIYSLDIYLASSLIDKIVYNKIFNFANMTQQQIIFKAPIVLIIVFSLSLLMGIIRKKIINVR